MAISLAGCCVYNVGMTEGTGGSGGAGGACVFSESRDSCGCCINTEHAILCPPDTEGAPDAGGVVTLPACDPN